MNARWLLGVIASVGVLTLIVVFVARMLTRDSVDKPLSPDSDRLSITVLEGHELWERGDRPEAVAKYKSVLREVSNATADRDHPVFRIRKLQEAGGGLHLELSTLFRRVIDHEAEYGDPAEARDWCVRAWNDWNLNLSLSSETAIRIWREVQAELGDTGQPVWKRVLNQ